MDIQRLNERINEYQRACSQLAKACAQPKNEFIRDSVIRRFKFCQESSLKVLKLKLTYENIITQTPRQIFQEALQARLIDDGNAWTEMQKMQNLTKYAYNEKLAETIYQFISAKGFKTLEALANQCSAWRVMT